MARCPDCGKFTGKNTEEEPEITEDMDIDKDGNATMTVRIVNQCEECNREMEEHEFQLEGHLDVGEHKGKKHELELSDVEIERTDSGGGRYAKRMFGVIAKVQVNCSCGDSVGNLELKDEVASSGMDAIE